METQVQDMCSVDEIINRNLMARIKMAKIIHEADGTVRYDCMECPEHYYTKTKLELHLLKHNKEYRYLCGICGAGLKRKEHLERHTQGHLGVRPHSCNVCGKAFKRKDHLNIHLSIHSAGKPLECEVCEKTFYRKDHLHKHMQIHTKLFLGDMLKQMAGGDVTIKQEIDEEYLTPIITSVSGGVGDTQIKMELPDATEESEGDNVHVIEDIAYQKMRPHVCVICKKRYKRKEHLNAHTATHMKKNKVCPECGLAFHFDGQLLSHINSVHLQAYQLQGDIEGIMRLKIMLGDKAQLLTASDGRDLLVPKNKKTKEEKAHVCGICNRRFARKQHLKVHGNIHTRNLRPTIWCSLCNEGFVANDQFESHHCPPREVGAAAAGLQGLQGPHEAKKENICSQDYVEVTEDQEHNDRIEGQEQNGIIEYQEYNDIIEEQEYLEERPLGQGDAGGERRLPVPQRVYVCKYCTKPFKRKDHYKIHLNIHTGIKSFFCPVCGKGFYRKDHLQKHTQVHSKGRATRRRVPDLYPIDVLGKEVLPEITIHAPSNTKLHVPLQMKVPYQMVMSMDNGEQRAITIDPQAATGLKRPGNKARLNRKPQQITI